MSEKSMKIVAGAGSKICTCSFLFFECNLEITVKRFN